MFPYSENPVDIVDIALQRAYIHAGFRDQRGAFIAQLDNTGNPAGKKAPVTSDR